MYKKIDLAILWFINIFGCQRQILLTCFMSKSAFADKNSIIDFYNSCIYNNITTKEILDFLLYNVMATMTTKYEKTVCFAKLWLFTKQNKLFAAVTQARMV